MSDQESVENRLAKLENRVLQLELEAAITTAINTPGISDAKTRGENINIVATRVAARLARLPHIGQEKEAEMYTIVHNVLEALMPNDLSE